jgi:hypothetical protein
MIALHDADDDKLNLSALDPDADRAAAERFVGAVMARVDNRPRPESMPADPLVGIWSLMRSPAIAAGIILVAALGTLALRQRQPRGPQTIAQAMGVPADFLTAPAPETNARPDSR